MPADETRSLGALPVHRSVSQRHRLGGFQCLQSVKMQISLGIPRLYVLPLHRLRCFRRRSPAKLRLACISCPYLHHSALLNASYSGSNDHLFETNFYMYFHD
jgi:hypothetical protein